MADRLTGSMQTRAEIEAELKKASWWGSLSMSEKDQILSVVATAADEIQTIHGDKFPSLNYNNKIYYQNY
jgi:hypothetical protein